MIKTFKYSIIICYWNIKKEWIKRCLKSIISTNYKNIEIILVDDGSDNEFKIEKDFFNFLINENILFKNVCIEHVGNAKAKKIGSMEVTSSDYIWFVDADDTIAEDAFNVMNKFLSKNDKVDVLNFNFISYYCQNNNFTNYIMVENKKNNKYIEYSIDGTEIQFEKLKKFDFCDWEWSNCLNIYRKDFIKKFNYPFYDGNAKYEDVFNSIVINSFSKRIASINKDLYVYWRNRSESITNINKHDIVYCQNILKIIKESFDKIDELNSTDKLCFNTNIFNAMIWNVLNKTTRWFELSKKEKRIMKKKYLDLINYEHINAKTKILLKTHIKKIFNGNIWKILYFIKQLTKLLFSDPKRLISSFIKLDFYEL